MGVTAVHCPVASAYRVLMQALQQLLDDFLAAHDPARIGDAHGGIEMPGVVMHVDSPRHGVHWSGAAGRVSRRGAALTPDVCFRTASVTKTHVATAVLRLVDRGLLRLDDALVSHLPERARSLLVASVGHAATITVEQVLRHTSGLYDFGTDSAYRRTIAREPHKLWTAYDLIGLAFDRGTSVGPAGESFRYSDTGYVLLALVLEHHTGLGIAAAVRDTLDLDALGLRHTWWEGKEPAPADAPPRAHQYLGHDDTFDFDPSFDGYGGGGLVSTAADLARFVREVVTGDVLRPPTRAAMLATTTPTDLGEMGQRCGLGIFASSIDGIERIGHEGFWGIWMYHLPQHDITIAGAHTGLPYDGVAKRALLHGPVHVLTA